MANRITATQVRKLAPDARLMDGEVKGFGVRRQGEGPAVYFLRYRAGKGRNSPSRWVTIGRDGSPWVPETARTEAKRLLGLVAAGQDPARVSEAQRRAITVADLCDRYLAQVATMPLPGKGRPKKLRTIETDRSNIMRHIKPLLGRRRIDELRSIDIERFQRDIASGKTALDERTRARGRARVRGGAGIAGRTVAVLGAIFAWGVREGIQTDNPVVGIATYKPKKLERYLSPDESRRLGETLTDAETSEDPAIRQNPYAVAAIRLLLLTGARKSEILTMRWDRVDFDRAVLRLADSKTGPREFPLSPAAMRVLEALPRAAETEFVFPSARGKSHFVGIQRVWSKIRRRAGIPDFRLHDLRHNFASQAAMAGHSLVLIGKSLGHSQSRTTEKYAHLHDDPVRAVAEKTAARIEAAVLGQGADVMPFKAAQAK